MMSSRRRLCVNILVLTAVSAVALASAHAQAPSVSERDRTAIAALSETFSKTMVAKDWKSIASLYTTDGVLYPAGESAVKGRASIEACLEPLSSLTGFLLRNTKVEGHDDLSYVQGTFTMTITPKGAAAPVEHSGYFLQILRRQQDGRWLIAVQMFSAQ